MRIRNIIKDLSGASPSGLQPPFRAANPGGSRGCRLKACPTKGSALLVVLWVTAALAAIGFSLASMVRGETDRTSTAVDGLRAYYLAAGAIHRAIYELLWSVENPAKRLIPRYSSYVDYDFPTGQVHVDLIPETAKLDVNTTPPDELYRLCVALGIEPERAREIALAIVDWRGAAAEGGSFDQFYASLTPSFRARHASIEEIEELLSVKGITPDIFYGTYVPAEAGSTSASGPMLVGRQGLVDCLSVYGSRGAVDANTAPPAVLEAIGLPPDVVSALVEKRRATPFTPGTLNEFLGAYGASSARLRLEGNSIITMRATARLRVADGKLSDLRRTAAAQVKYMPQGFDAPIHILRWYDTAWSF
jgi:general secretion pathway protein K